MFLNANQLDNDAVLETEICVIGGGIAGITFVREFLGTNSEIILLESGESEFSPKAQDLTTGSNTGLPYFDLDITRARAFGGTSHLWCVDINQSCKGVRLRGLDEMDFEKRDWVPYSGWPIGKRDLDPYYEAAHRLFGIGPYSYAPEDWAESNETHSLPFRNENVETTVFQFARADLFFTKYRSELEKAKNVFVYTDSTVLNISTNQGGNLTTDVKVSTSSGRKFTVTARCYVLALGGLETPRLLMLSNGRVQNGLGNQRDLVGRFFMEHPHLKRNPVRYFPSHQGLFRKPKIYELQEKNGVPILGYLKLSDDIVQKHKLLNFTTAIYGEDEKRIQRLDEGVGSIKSVLSSIKRGKIPKEILPKIGNALRNMDVMAYEIARKVSMGKEEDWNRFQREYTGIKLDIMAEQIPDPESRVRLGTAKDRFGQPKIELNWRMNAADFDSIRRSLEILDEEMRKADLGHIAFPRDSPLPQIGGGYHHMGTTRMHDDPAFGVVDRHCKVHGNENLFVAGSSVFPTGGYANPTLTVVALTLRLAEHVKKVEKSL